MRRRTLAGAGTLVIAATAGVLAAAHATPAAPPDSVTAIKHVVVIFDENESFDHYFGTYPTATNTDETAFTAAGGTPAVNGLTNALLTANPNHNNPARLGPDTPVTCDHNHNYGAEQLAFNGGAMNKFYENTGGGSCADKGIVMDYYDGNTVTALWNLAQGFTMSDASFGTTFGPSTIGAINFISGNTHGVQPAGLGEGGTMILNSQPALDDCSAGKGAGLATMTGRNIGDLLNDRGVTWGWFAGGFRPASWDAAGDAVCGGSQTNAAGAVVGDYLPHHEPFQYYASTANRHHLPPSSVAAIGTTDQANHQYDLKDFDAAINAGKLPQVSFLKAVSAEDSHAGYSGPTDEQHWLIRVLNELQRLPDWSSTAVVIAYDDSDGWYDHVNPTKLQGSDGPSDALDGSHACALGALNPSDYRGRCGPGPRLPLLVISPWVNANTVNSTPLEQTSITKFIEDNWALGRIGDQSFDARATSLSTLFNFGGAGNTPKMFFNANGTVAGGPPATRVAIAPARPDPAPRVVPTATPVVTVAPTVTPKPSPTPTPTPTPKLALKLSCKTTGGGKKVTVSCSATGADASKKTSLRFDIKKGSKVLATGKASLSKKKAKLVIKPKKKIKAGKYTL